MSEKIVVRQTTNYGMFELLPFNRDVKNTRELEASLRTHGWIHSKPLDVIPKGNTGKYLIRDGHNRFIAAQKLGIPILYVVCKDDADVFRLVNTTRMWTVSDFLESHCRTGKEDYLEAKRYCTETGIPVGLALSMLMGQTAGSGNWGERFKRGNYQINRSSNHAAIMKDLVLLCKTCGVEFYNKSLFVQALSRVVFTKEVDLSRLKTKIKKFAHAMSKRSSLDQYLEMFEELYNWKSTSKIPVKFLAHEAAKKRSAVVREV